MWDRESDSRELSVEVKEPLPSDSRFRDDLNALAAGDMEKAQFEKNRMEEVQRREAKLRKEGKRGQQDGDSAH